MAPRRFLQDGSPVPSDHRSAITWVSVAFIVATVFFLSVPQIDLVISAWFFGPDGFVRGGDSTAQAIRDVFKLSFTVLCAAVIIAAIVREAAGIRLFRLSRSEVWYLVVSLAMGPGILVNSVFKDHWGRARPVTVEEFGGDLVFSPVWMIAGQCERNCSFMSGEAAAGFSLIALALIAGRYRAWVFMGALTVGVIMGLVRIAMGGHFFSDTVFSALTVTLVSLVAHHVIVGGHDKGIMKAVIPLVKALETIWTRLIDSIEQQARRK